MHDANDELQKLGGLFSSAMKVRSSSNKIYFSANLNGDGTAEIESSSDEKCDQQFKYFLESLWLVTQCQSEQEAFMY